METHAYTQVIIYIMQVPATMVRHSCIISTRKEVISIKQQKVLEYSRLYDEINTAPKPRHIL